MMTKQKCPKCGSTEFESSPHLYFEKGIYAHKCKRCGILKDSEIGVRTIWKGEKYEHNKYPEANLEKVDLRCSECDCKTAYVSEHFSFIADMLSYRCCDCEKVWYK